ncbi:MAG: glycosyltransferase family 4 protein [Deltaproteobacteria bacterium]|nr:MAG: glycosyltransferase family 4 protein [Deltaproteobacteria bacterium]
MTACLFGTYVRAHSANRLLRLALAGAGFAVTECHEPLWEETADKGGRYFGALSLARLAARYVRAARQLAQRWRGLPKEPPPLVVVGFGGQLDVLLARRLCRPRAGLVFAPLVSLTETLVEDRKLFRPRGAVGRALAALDRAALRAADLILADTAAHADYLGELGASQVAVWYLGVEPEFLPRPPVVPVARRVLFYGRYLPLHGVDTIVEAAARLGDRAEVVLIGCGPERPRIEALARVRGASVTFRDEVPLAALSAELASASVVLGVFGAGRKAAMVVPNKVYQAAACGRPLVTRDGPGLREVLRPGDHCLVCPPADPAALAAAISTLLDDARLAERMGHAARVHLLERFAPEQQAEHLGALLVERLGIAPPAPPSVEAARARVT